MKTLVNANPNIVIYLDSIDFNNVDKNILQKKLLFNRTKSYRYVMIRG